MVENLNNDLCFADKGFSRCNILTKKKCKNCRFRMTTEEYRRNRQKYKDKEKEYLDRHGITYKEEWAENLKKRGNKNEIWNKRKRI